MVVRKITLNKKEYFMDEFFNIYGDKDKKEHKGVLQVRGEKSDQFYIAPKARRTKEKLDTDEDEYDEFWSARKLFNKKMAGKAPAKPAAAGSGVVSSEGGAVAVKPLVGSETYASVPNYLGKAKKTEDELAFERAIKAEEEAYRTAVYEEE